jgi:hypothetical protein
VALRDRLIRAHTSLQHFVDNDGPWGDLHAKAKGVLDVATDRLAGAEGYVSDALRCKAAAESRAAEVRTCVGAAIFMRDMTCIRDVFMLRATYISYYARHVMLCTTYHAMFDICVMYDIYYHVMYDMSRYVRLSRPV